MKLLVDSLSTTTGWAGSGAKATVHGINELPEFIAGLNPSSLVFKFDAGANGLYVQKTLSFNLTGYTELVFHAWSRNIKRRGWDYRLSSDYAYKIEFGDVGNSVFFVPLCEGFTDITLKVNLAACTKIKITCLHNSEDYLIVSNLVAVKDELPKDIFQAVKEQLETDLSFLYGKIAGGVVGKGIQIGTISATTGDAKIHFPTAVPYAEKYAVIRIDDGVHSEIHQIDKDDEGEKSFFSTYNGKSILNDFVNAPVYLVVPVEYGLSEKEIILPGIALWGMNPEEVFEAQSKQDLVHDTFRSNETVQARRFDTAFRYLVLIDCEARTNELVALMSQCVRYFMARETLWVNGKKLAVKNEGASSFIEPTEGFNEIPKVQYTLRVDVKEETMDRETLVRTIQNNRTFEQSINQ